MGLGKDRKEIIWVKKTQFSKTTACLFIYHELLTKKRVSKNHLEKVLNIDSRITIYNYISELKAFLYNLDMYLDYIIDIYYDPNAKEYVLDLRKKQ